MKPVSIAIAAVFVRRCAGRIALLVLVTALSMFAMAPVWASETGLVAHVLEFLSDEERHPLVIESHREELQKFYSSEDADILFVGTLRSEALVARMADGEYDGLDPIDYPIEFLEDVLDESLSASVERQAEIEAWFASHFLEFAADMKVGRVLPRKVYPDDYIPRKNINGDNVLRAVAAFSDMDEFFAAWEPFNPEYRKLKSILQRLIEIRNQGGWPLATAVNGDEPTGEINLENVRRRLAFEDYIDRKSGPASGPDAGGLEVAIKQFQARYRLPMSGELDNKTVIAMNTPTEKRIQQVSLAMERLRWLPESLAERVIYVNKSEGIVRAITDERVEKSWLMKPNCPRENATIAASPVRSVTLNPPWLVPFDYFTKNILPQLKDDPKAVESAGYELRLSNTREPIASYPWKSISDRVLNERRDSFSFRLMPGPNNPYGKFIVRLADLEDIYLFDAPEQSGDEICDLRHSKSSFALIDGLDLLNLLVAPNQAKDDLIRKQIEHGNTTTYPRYADVPVMITFQSAWIGTDGAIRYGRDPFYEDKRLERALRGRFTPL